MARPGTDRHEGGIAVREAAYHTSTAVDFPIQPHNDIIGTDASPEFAGKIAVSQRLFNAVLHLLGSLFQLHRVQLLYHGFDFPPSSYFVFLGMECLEQLCLGARCYREHIAVKMGGTALVLGFEKCFSHSLQHTKAFVSNHKFDSIQTTAAQPLEEFDPAGLVRFHTFGRPQNLTVSLFIHRNHHPNCHIFKLSASISAQADPIRIDIRIAPTLQRAVPRILNVDISFLVQLTDGGRRHLAAPTEPR